MNYYRFIYRVKNNSTFRFNEEGDLLKEVTIISTNKVKAFTILKENYPHFRKDEVMLHTKEALPELFK